MSNLYHTCNDTLTFEYRKIEEAICKLQKGTCLCLEAARQIECGCVCDGAKDFIDGLCIEERGLIELLDAIEDLDECDFRDKCRVEKGICEIREGLKEEKVGLLKVLDYDTCEGVELIHRGVNKIRDGIEDVSAGLEKHRHRCESELQKGLTEIREGIRHTCDGIADIECGKVRKGEDELEEALIDLQRGLDDLSCAAESLCLSYCAQREYDEGLCDIREGIRLIRRALRDINKCQINDGLCEAREGLCLEQAGLRKVLDAIDDCRC